MAKGTGQKKPLHELRQEIAHSRDRLAREIGGLRYEFDFPLKLRKSVQRHTGTWIAAVAVIGVLSTLLPRRRKVVVETSNDREKKKKGILEAGFALAAVKFAAKLLRPVITTYVRQHLAARVAGSRRRRW